MNQISDTFAFTISDTRKDVHLLHPSVSTAFNETTMITSFKDEDMLLDETRQDLSLKIIQCHDFTRRLEHVL